MWVSIFGFVANAKTKHGTGCKIGCHPKVLLLTSFLVDRWESCHYVPAASGLIWQQHRLIAIACAVVTFALNGCFDRTVLSRRVY